MVSPNDSLASLSWLTLYLELSIAPHLNHRLVPPHMKPVLAAKGLDIDNFNPMPREEMMARLD
jgi:glycogen synthase kinase 3 beta